MVQDTNSSILSEPETTFEEGSEEVKQRAAELAEEDTPEAKDEMMALAKDHGVEVTPSMTAEEINDSIHDVM